VIFPDSLEHFYPVKKRFFTGIKNIAEFWHKREARFFQNFPTVYFFVFLKSY
jgi:hypothetical protein